MDAALILVVGFAAVLVGFVAVARVLRSRMRSGRFHGIESAVGGSAFMGATREPGVAPPEGRNFRTGSSQPEPSTSDDIST
ncbi:Homeobox-leucine zipper protein ATHB-14 [Rhodococcus sp. AW25M09]|uniref:hypothetical protein n=1 Tax=Rhodococcus sp. AW25M09 TaxID=1268303 RepID=UPI0002AC7A36|nr:hypothetical protein [Rhodococcus sp. AW25M09]CCQ16353.1 Homeobox-leucine zipper protein ATHB-14 [Rhodococcus sp. AW25M09]